MYRPSVPFWLLGKAELILFIITLGWSTLKDGYQVFYVNSVEHGQNIKQQCFESAFLSLTGLNLMDPSLFYLDLSL